MFCKKCGCVIDDDAVFCYKCGEKISDNNNHDNLQPIKNEEPITITKTETPKESKAQPTLGKIIRKIDYSSLSNQSLIIGGIVAIIGIRYVFEIFDIPSWNYYDNQRTVAFVMIVLAIIGLSSCLIMSSNHKKRFVNICENGICGIGPGASNYTNEKFEIFFEDVIKIEKGTGYNIIIQSKSSNQTIPVPSKEFDYIFDLLKNLISKAQTK